VAPWADTLDRLPHPGDPGIRRVAGNLPRAWHQYYGVQAWNADSSVLMLTAGKRQAAGRGWIRDHYLVRDIENPEPEHHELRSYKYVHWSVTDPEVLYLSKYEGETFELQAYNINTRQTATALAGRCPTVIRLQDLHPDGTHALFAPVSDRAGQARIYDLRTKRQVWEHTFEHPVHRIRFTHHARLSTWVSYHAHPTHKFALLFPGADGRTTETELTHSGGHITTNRDGTVMAGYYPERCMSFSDISSPEKANTILHTWEGIRGEGHYDWSPCGRFVAVDVGKAYGQNRPLGRTITLIDVRDNYRVIPVCYHDSRYRTDEGRSIQSWHPHVVVSPNSRMLVFNSNLGGDDPNVSHAYVAGVPKSLWPATRPD
jgi:hypothetical protein